ncbi:MAG: hypothetical protein ABFD83_08025 [Armatimonadota bacterium]
MISKLKIPLIAAAVLALGIIIYPYPPRVNGNALLHKVLLAQRSVEYTAVQEHTSVMLGSNIRSTIHVKNDCRTASTDAKLESQIFRNYIPLVEGQYRIAGRDAWVLRLKPKLKHMPWKQIWVDKTKFVVLASRDWTAYNVIKRSMKTISISFDSEPMRETNAERTNHIAKCDIPRPSYMLHGFVPTSADKGTLVYSDGLYTITITTSDKSACRKNKALDWGQGTIYSTGRYTVVADLPADMIERIARSITP